MALIPGLFRSEIVALLIGAGAALVFFFSLATTLIRRARNWPRAVHLEFEHAEISSGVAPRLRLRINDSPMRMEVAVVFTSGVRVIETLFLHVGGSDQWYQLPRFYRGLFRADQIEIAVPDPFRLTSLRFFPSVDEEVYIRVLPYTEELSALFDVRGYGGRDLETYISLDRNDDLVEARPYHPGDDATKLHWSLYAHTGDLFVRQGEEVPPPRRSVLVTIDAFAAGSVDGESGALILDRVIAHGLGLAVQLEERGFTVSVAVAFRERIVTCGKPSEATRSLAALDIDGRWLEAVVPPELIERGTSLFVTTGIAEICPPDVRGRSVVVLLMDEIDQKRVKDSWVTGALD